MYNNTNDKFRNKIVHKLNNQLDNIQISRNIEKSIYNHTIEISKQNNINRNWHNKIFKELYLSKVRSIYTNIKVDSYIKNNSFKDKIKNGQIDASKICSLTTYDIFPDNWKYLLEIKSKQDKLKYELKPEAMTDMFKCRKCGSRSTSYYELQTRSADEPMTQFITCLECSTRWKQ